MKKETRVYLIDIDNTELDFYQASQEEIIAEAEKQGNVYSLKGFEKAFNSEEIEEVNSYILITDEY